MKKLFIIIGVLLILIFISLFFSFKMFLVSGNSMEPSLEDGNKILIFKTAYFFSEIERGDIVLANVENKTIVKRIVALPGEKVEIKGGKIKIDEKELYESYLKEIHTYGDQRVFLDENQYYILGDNREPNQSVDSRILGPITKKSILGKVIAILSPEFKFIRRQAFQLGTE